MPQTHGPSHVMCAVRVRVTDRASVHVLSAVRTVIRAPSMPRSVPPSVPRSVPCPVSFFPVPRAAQTGCCGRRAGAGVGIRPGSPLCVGSRETITATRLIAPPIDRPGRPPPPRSGPQINAAANHRAQISSRLFRRSRLSLFPSLSATSIARHFHYLWRIFPPASRFPSQQRLWFFVFPHPHLCCISPVQPFADINPLFPEFLACIGCSFHGVVAVCQ